MPDEKALVPADLAFDYETKIMLYALDQEKTPRALKNLLMLTGTEGMRKINNARTRKLILQFIFDRDPKDLDYLAINYKGKIRSAYFKITELIGQAEKPVPEDYQKLFEALGRISAFWFYVRGEDENLVRITDVYMFQLLSILKIKFPSGKS